MINNLINGLKGLFRDLKNNEEGASHILEVAASLAIVATILGAIFPNITKGIIDKITDVINRAISSF